MRGPSDRTPADIGTTAPETARARALPARAPLPRAAPVRRALVGASDGVHEPVADRIARLLAGSLDDGTSAHVFSGPSTRIRRATADVGPEGGSLDAGLAADISRARGGGSPLPAPMRDQMERAFATDFSGVRVHADAAAGVLNRRIQASAFTIGNDIFFRDGLPDTDSRTGQQLVAHELTHVVQQTGNAHRQVSPRVQRAVQISVGDGAGLYPSGRLRGLADAVAVVINQDGRPAKRGPLRFVHAPETYTFTTLYDLAEYMLADDPIAPDPDELADAPLPEMELEYGKDHGDYHFTGKVTKKKAQWTISQARAIELMEAELRTHMRTLVTQSKAKGWESWYIGADAGETIGETVAGAESAFCMQVQVNVGAQTISYHGYPDQRLVKTGVGKSKSSITGGD
jgi:hypothetical protein